ncbi:rta1 domain-containing protein [Stagonosporopsis vannaccii]|nr:rta1 domain-containing protein [Stagonosporopsis vannaccii]
MTTTEQIMATRNCTDITPQCPLQFTVYGYEPDLAANAFFVGCFGLAVIIQLTFGIKYKTWSYMTVVSLGCLAECIGYIGRLMLHKNPWNHTGFKIQIVLLVFAPALLAAGIYLSLKHTVIQFGAEWSRFRPGWYTYIFVACDIVSLTLQTVGGALAAGADPGSSILNVGTDIMLAGIIWQVVVLIAFGYLVAEYCMRTYRRRDQLSMDALLLWNNGRFKLFCGSTVVAYVAILIRCIYRIPELNDGWGGKVMRDETDFIVLESVMITIAVAAQTLFHPGFCFPAFGKKMIDNNKQEEAVLCESKK